MKKLFYYIALFAMMFFAVQGYAQRREGRNGGERQSVTRSHTPSSRSSVRREAAPRREQARPQSNVTRSNGNPSVQRRDNNVRQEPARRENNVRQGNARRENNVRREPARHERVRHNQHPPRREYHSPRPKPSFGHHHLYHHHTHRCIFDSWDWYIWGNYHNRFIRHMHYHNRFFDSLLGYYIWGSIDVPERIEIGNMSFTRYNDMLKIKIGNQYTYLDLYRYANVCYTIGYTTVNVVTSNGYATIYFEDDYGNTASYRL